MEWKNVKLNLVQKESYWAGGPPPRPKTKPKPTPTLSRARQTAAAGRVWGASLSSHVRHLNKS